ncbi:P-loop containing nucleoside triphosphate hydrolase protein [Aspergillus ambiguus]|uniref:P-loop containing nucleoside triphosphate hydrolase protein n=1 Tax=Aspergillus ambiguus TaxID=176160 RepID=UPI003CCE286B
MGHSGCGKTTLLDALAHRSSNKAQVSSTVLINGQKPSISDIRMLSSYVECDDALIGALTVKETLHFAARLSLAHIPSAGERARRVDELLHAFGLVDQANTIVGTLVKKGISTGQKRRLSVAAQLISGPKILFLDEPTSGLDSHASFNVMSFVRDVAKVNNLLVIVSIHQPSTMTFAVFDKLLLLSAGKTCYYGDVRTIKPYFDSIGFAMPTLTNPADFLLSLTNIDFERDTQEAERRLEKIHATWKTSHETDQAPSAPKALLLRDAEDTPAGKYKRIALFHTTLVLLHRAWIKSCRDILVYGLRFGMYLGLAILMGTVWLRLPPTQSSLQPYANCILFGSAFMSFMAVVYVPAFIEDRMVYTKDRANGLYGSTAFIVSNFLVGLPYLFLIAFVSSTFIYWMVNFRPDGTAFLTWVLWMYLNLVAAESLVVLMSSLFPNSVGALALTAMANGIWMACNGFMVPVTQLNPFYRYVFYYINYQAYVFRGLVSNEFGYRDYSCGKACFCQYDTSLRDQCMIAGDGVLEMYGFGTGELAIHVGITLGIIAVMRVFGWAALKWR